MVGETFKNTSEANSNESTNNNGWSDFPPFNDKNKLDGYTESESKTEVSDFNIINGVEYRNLDKIDIASEQGKYEWIDSLVENCKSRIDSEYDDIIREEGLYGMDRKEQEEYLEFNDNYQDNRREYDLVKRQSKILENLDVEGEGGVLGALDRKRKAFGKAMDNPEASNEAQTMAYENWYAAENLYFILSEEVGKRDPKYFDQNLIRSQLNNKIRNAEDALEKSYIVSSGSLTDKGYIDMSMAGEKHPTAATEDAEIDLKYAKQDAETFELIMNMDDHMSHAAIKKADFAPTINEFIEDHTARIDQLWREAEMFPKNSDQYAENQAKRTKLAKERSSARRLRARYFNVADSESIGDGASMEQIPTGKTKEQIEAEKSEKKRKEEYQQKINEYWEQKRQAEQKRREESEQQIRAKQEAEAERQRRIREAEEAVKRSYEQEFEEGQEEMGM